MGHLVNPTGFRLGYIPTWLDTWFYHKEAYPEIIHFVIKIRVFLNNFFDINHNPYAKDAILFSHFRLIFNLTNIFIYIFFYPANILLNYMIGNDWEKQW